MGAARPGNTSATHNALENAAFIDINFENPSNTPNQKNINNNFNNNNNNRMMYQGQQQFYNANRNYPITQGYPNPPPQMNNQYPYGYNNPNMNPNMMVMPNNSMSSLGGNNNNMNSNMPKNNSRRQRRNSNSSMVTTMSVNKFMKKQWGKLGNGVGMSGLSNGSSMNLSNKNHNKRTGDYDDDDDKLDDGKFDVDINQAEVSFEDLQHMRGDRVGAFGLNDSTPYIPTLKTNMNAGGQPNKMSGDQYRKLQNAQKKAMTMNMANQQKFQSQNPNQFAPPRSMSLQSYRGNPYQQQQNFPPFPNQYPQNFAYNQHPMPYQNMYPQPPNQQQQQFPANPSVQNMYKSQPHPPNKNQDPNQWNQNTVNGPRSMSLQSGNTVKQYRIPSNDTHPVPIKEDNVLTDMGRKESKEDASGHKKLSKIEFNDIADDSDNNLNPVEDDKLTSQKNEEQEVEEFDDSTGVVETVAELPIKSDVVQRKNHQVTRSGIDSIVSFDSISQKEQKLKQEKLYKLKNNSTGNTLFYSANEFITNNDEDDNVDNGKNNEQPLQTHEEEESGDVHDITNKLDDMVLNKTPLVDHGAFKNNYGNYGDLNAYDIDVTDTPTESLHLKKHALSDNRNTVDSTPSIRTEDSKNDIINMGLDISKESVGKAKEDKKFETNLSSSNDMIKEFTPPPTAISTSKNAHDSIITNSSILSTPSKIRSIDTEPRTPNSLTVSIPASVFTPEQYGLLNDNNALLQELELVTTELASSVTREIALEDNLRKQNLFKENNTSISDFGNVTLKDDVLDNVDKSSANKDILKDVFIEPTFKTESEYANTISKLAESLNEERKKRYLAEEMIMEFQSEYGSESLQNKLVNERRKVMKLENEIENHKESIKLFETEKELLKVENEQLLIELNEIKRKWKTANDLTIPRLREKLATMKE